MKIVYFYFRRIHAEAIFCLFKEAESTFHLAQSVINELSQMNALPNVAGLYANFSTLYYIRSEYDEVYIIILFK